MVRGGALDLEGNNELGVGVVVSRDDEHGGMVLAVDQRVVGLILVALLGRRNLHARGAPAVLAHKDLAEEHVLEALTVGYGIGRIG